MNPHLDARRLRAWLDGDLPADDRAALLAHLETGCEICDALIDDDLLARLLAAEEAPPEPPPPLRVPARPARRAWPWGLAAAAAAALAVGVLLPRGDDTLTEKGTGGAPAIRMQVAVETDGVAGPPLADGAVVAKDAVLVFTLDTDVAAPRYLMAMDATGARQVLLPPEGREAPVEPPGLRPATWKGEWVALALDDLTAPVWILAATTPSPIASPGSAELTVRTAP